jgi:hypothetical protein
LVYTGWCRKTGTFEIMRKKRRKLTKLYLILKMCSTRVEISLGITFLKITLVKCCPFRCTHSEDAAQCVLRNVGDVFLSWARFVGLVWYARLFFQSRTSLLKVTNPRAYCVRRRNLIVAPKHSLCSYHTVSISAIHTRSCREPNGQHLTEVIFKKVMPNEIFTLIEHIFRIK